VIRAFAESPLRSGSGSEIGFFDGATYLAPDAWLPSDRGYGYTSSDTSIQGVNVFNPATCAGGGAPPCFVPLSTAEPGDIIADNTSLVSGSAIQDENFIITHRVKTDATQQAGIYTAEVTYLVTATNY